MYSRTLQIVVGVHVLTLAVCTYIAAIEIESILVTGFICSATGFMVGAMASVAKKRVLAFAGFLTPILAVTLFILEAFILNLGPDKAALPFCIVFIANQVIATVVMLVQMYVDLESEGAQIWRLTIRMLLLLTVSFSVFFAIAKYLLQRDHNVMMWTALGLLGLTFVGLSLVLFTAFSKSRDETGNGVNN